MSVEFKIGADPELFVRDRDGNLVSAHGMIPGTKAAPHKVEHGAVQVDGMALEFNIDPANSLKEWDRNITSVLAQLKEMIPNGYSFDFSPVAEFGADYIKAQPDEARELGCDPDFDAWNSGMANPKPNGDYPFRTASGHIHIGWTNGQDIDVPEHIEACIMASKQLDTSLYFLSKKWDRDTVRQNMYGKPGAFRPKHYGVEYRTLSNTWVDDAERRELVYRVTNKVMEQLLTGNQYYNQMSLPDFNYYLGYKYEYEIRGYQKSVLRILGEKSITSLFNKLPEFGNKKEEEKVEPLNALLKAQMEVLERNMIRDINWAPAPQAIPARRPRAGIAIQGQQAQAAIIDDFGFGPLDDVIMDPELEE